MFKRSASVRALFLVLVFCFSSGAVKAAIIPNTEGNVPQWGSTRIDFCQKTNQLYAFTGLNLYRYNPAGNNFVIAIADVGAATDETWDPADFAFGTAGNFVALPTGWSQRFVKADMPSGPATEKTNLNKRSYFSTASRFRADELYANADYNDTINNLFKLNTSGNGSETRLTAISGGTNVYSGGLAFDAADNAYIADFSPFGSAGLGHVDIYIVSRGQLDAAAADSNFVVVPRLLVNDAVLAGSDSMVIDGAYDIYVCSSVGIAKITATSDANVFTVTNFAGDIDENPWGAPVEVFCGITADIRTGTLYFGKSIFYAPYYLYQLQITPVTDWFADLEGNGITDLSDLEALSADYLSSGSYLPGDLNDDSIVDFRDFAIFSKQWKNKAPWYRAN